MGREKTPLADTLAVQQRIVVAAETLFRDVGYSKTTVDEIAGTLGMSQANVYRYFPTKPAINKAISERVMLRIEARCQMAMLHSASARQALEQFLLEYFRSVRDNVMKE